MSFTDLKLLIAPVFFWHPPLLVLLVVTIVAVGLIQVFPLFKAPEAIYGRLYFLEERIGRIAFWSLCLYVVFYAFYPAFSSVGEATTASLSWIWANGSPLYHSGDSAQRYSLLYGPLIYILMGSILYGVGPSILVSKLVEATIFLLFQFVGWRTFRALMASSVALGALAVCDVLFAYNILPIAALLTLLTCLGTLVYVRGKEPYRPILLGALIGLAVCVKIHGGFYFLPFLFSMLAKRDFKAFALASVAAMITSLAPFLLPGISLQGYAFWLSKATAHGLALEVFRAMAEWVVFGGLSVVAFCAIHAPATAGTRYQWRRPAFIGAMVSVVSVLIFASKPGSTFHHLIPLLPPLFAALAEAGFIRKPDEQMAPVPKVGWVKLFGVVFLSLVWGVWLLHVGYNTYNLTRIPALRVRQDLDRILAENKSLTVAIGDSEKESGGLGNPRSDGKEAAFKTYLLFKGQPMLLDTVSLIDMQASGLPIPEATFQKLREGYVQIWLFLKGTKPFEVINWYNNQQVFSPEFKQAFYDNYEHRGDSEFFELWYYKASPKQK